MAGGNLVDNQIGEKIGKYSKRVNDSQFFNTKCGKVKRLRPHSFVSFLKLCPGEHLSAITKIISGHTNMPETYIT